MLGGLIAAAVVATVALTSAGEVRIAGRDVRLGDVATVSAPVATKLRQLVIARLPQGTTERIRRSELVLLVRHAAPGIRVVGDIGGALTIRSIAPSVAMAPMKPYVAQAPAIEPGQKLTLTAHAGPAVIERPVIALQEARKGDARLFVKTDDGEVFSAPIQSAVEQ